MCVLVENSLEVTCTSMESGMLNFIESDRCMYSSGIPIQHIEHNVKYKCIKMYWQLV